MLWMLLACAEPGGPDAAEGTSAGAGGPAAEVASGNVGGPAAEVAAAAGEVGGVAAGEVGGPAAGVATDWAPCPTCRWRETERRVDPELLAVRALVKAAAPRAALPMPSERSGIPEDPSSFEVFESGDLQPGRWWMSWTTPEGVSFAARVEGGRATVWAAPFPADVVEHVGWDPTSGWRRRQQIMVDAPSDADLVNGARDPHPLVRLTALRGMADREEAMFAGTSRRPPAGTPLPDGWRDAMVAGMGSPDPRIRSASVYAAAASGDGPTLAAVAPLVCDADSAVRWNAIHAIGPWWPANALAPWLVDPDLLVARTAAAIHYALEHGVLPTDRVADPEGFSDPFDEELRWVATDWTRPWSATAATRLTAHGSPVQPALWPPLREALPAGPPCQPSGGLWTLDLWSPALASAPVAVTLTDADGAVVGSGIVPISLDWTGVLTMPVTSPPRQARFSSGANVETVTVSPARQDAVAALCTAGGPEPRFAPPEIAVDAARLWLERAWVHDPVCAALANAALPALPIQLVAGLVRDADVPTRLALVDATRDRPEDERRKVLEAALQGAAPDPALCAVVAPELAVATTHAARELRACGEVDPASRDAVIDAMIAGRMSQNGIVTLAQTLPKGELVQRAAHAWLVDGSAAGLEIVRGAAGSSPSGMVTLSTPIHGVAAVLVFEGRCDVGPPADVIDDAVIVVAADPDKPAGRLGVVRLDARQAARVQTAVCDSRVVWRRPAGG